MRRTYLAAVVAGVCAMAFPAGALANTGEHKTAQHNVAAQGNAQGLQANVHHRRRSCQAITATA